MTTIEEYGLEIAKATAESVGKESANKLFEIIGGIFPFWGLKKKAVSTYISEIENSNLSPEVKMMAIFGFIAYIGLEILLWQLFIAIFKLEKRAVKIYLTWIRTNQLYINASVKKEEMEQNGGSLDE